MVFPSSRANQLRLLLKQHRNKGHLCHDGKGDLIIRLFLQSPIYCLPFAYLE